MSYTPRPFDLAGQRFGRLLVIGEVEPLYSGKTLRRRVACQCDCGNIAHIRIDVLKRGVRSCGCGRKKIHGRKQGITLTPEEKSSRFFMALRKKIKNMNQEMH